MGLALAVIFQSKITSFFPPERVWEYLEPMFGFRLYLGEEWGERRNRSLFSIAPSSSVNKQWIRKIFAATKN